MRPRSPAAPGPGPIPPEALRQLDLALQRRIDGSVPGDRRTPALGDGSELAQVRPYVAGDDVRRLDVNAFARTGEPHVRVHMAERAATTWLAIDWSASMAFGTADRRKCDVAEGAAIACAQVASRRGGRVGVLRCGTEQAAILPPRQGRGGLRGVHYALGAEPPLDGPETVGMTLRGGLEHALRLARSRGAIVAISDFRGEETAEALLPVLRKLTARHGVLAIEVRDPREDELPAIGDVWVRDPETGRSLRVDTNSDALRRRFAEAAAAEREATAKAFRSAGVAHCVLSTRGSWLRQLARFLDLSERVRR